MIRTRKETGLQAATDGEFRCAEWHLDFLWSLDEMAAVDAGSGMNLKGGFSGRPMVEHLRFAAQNTRRFAKPTIPGPSMPHVRGA